MYSIQLFKHMLIALNTLKMIKGIKYDKDILQHNIKQYKR